MRYSIHLDVVASKYVTSVVVRNQYGIKVANTARPLTFQWPIEDAEAWGLQTIHDLSNGEPLNYEFVHHKLDGARTRDEEIIERSILLHTALLREVEAEIRRSNNGPLIAALAIGRTLGSLLRNQTSDIYESFLDTVVRTAKHYAHLSQETVNDREHSKGV